MKRRDDLAREAVTAALRVRTRTGHAADEAVCPLDVAERLEVAVRLEPLASLEGMYSPDGPTIVLGSLRPFGRRSFTCGHELGHHSLGHGFRVDELVDGDANPSTRDGVEYAADRFAAALLMPKLAVASAFTSRGWTMAACTAEQVYVVAGALGVGYTTLAGYLHHTLHEVDNGHASRLIRERTSKIRRRLLGFEPPRGLLVVDRVWGRRPADIEVADLMLVPRDSSIDGACLLADGLDHEQRVVRAVAPGTGRVSKNGWSVTVRIARSAFRGLAGYRHLEDADDEP